MTSKRLSGLGVVVSFPKTKTVGCGVFIISTSHVLKYAHCFAIVDESCTLLSKGMWLLRMSIDAASWREGPSPEVSGRASTSARIGALRVVRIDPSSGADTSSARTRGGGRPAELKVVTPTPENRDKPFSMHNVTRRAATFAKDSTQPAISSTPLSKTSQGVTLISLKIYSPTSCYQFTNCGSRIGELMTKDSRANASPSWTF